MCMGETNAKHKVSINVHEGVRKPDDNYNKIQDEIARSYKSKRKSLYDTTGHASFRPFRGIDDDLANPLSRFISRRAPTNHR
jgi:hypothetical protein